MAFSPASASLSEAAARRFASVSADCSSESSLIFWAEASKAEVASAESCLFKVMGFFGVPSGLPCNAFTASETWLLISVTATFCSLSPSS